MEVLSLTDLKDSFHTLALAKKPHQYCLITSYYSLSPYMYQRLAFGLGASSVIYVSKIGIWIKCIISYLVGFHE